MPNDPTICAASDVACGEVGAGPGARLAEAHLLGHEPAEGDRDAGLDLRLRAR